jgi:hypothetical protein
MYCLLNKGSSIVYVSSSEINWKLYRTESSIANRITKKAMKDQVWSWNTFPEIEMDDAFFFIDSLLDGIFPENINQYWDIASRRESISWKMGSKTILCVE